MKKTFSFDSIIGKKSKVRMPHHVYTEKQEKVIAILPANNAIAEPPFSTNITMKKGDPYDLCDQVNEKSQEYNTDIPLRVIVTITNTATECDVKETPIFELLNMAFDLEDRNIESLQASKNDLLLASTNFAIIKSSPSEDYFYSDLIANTKSVFGSILSYNSHRRLFKHSVMLTPKDRFKNYLKDKLTNSYNKKAHQSHIQHFVYKTFKALQKRRLPLLFERIDYFYDVSEDWDEAFDHFWTNHNLINLFDLFEYSLIALNYSTFLNYLIKDAKESYYLLQQESLYKVLRTLTKSSSDYDKDLMLPFKPLIELYSLKTSKFINVNLNK